MILKLKDQVSSLESSMKLKSLNCPKSSLFYWEKSPYSNEYSIFMRNTGDIYMQDWCSAYTASELGVMLPRYINAITGVLHFWKEQNTFCITYNGSQCLPVMSEGTEVEARSKILCYLLENKLIEVPK